MTQTNRTTTILVTGAAGFIGSHTVDQLLYRGHRVIGIDDLSSGSRANLSRANDCPNFEFHAADVLEPRFLLNLCRRERPTAIVHLAGLAFGAQAEEDPQLNFRLNVETTQAVAEASRRAGVPRIVFASSAAVYGNGPAMPHREDTPAVPANHLGSTKLISEHLLHHYGRSHGLTTICLRYFNVFGPRQDGSSPSGGVVARFADRHAHGQPIVIFGDGSQTRDFISVHDVSYANTLAALSPNLACGSYNICTGQSVSVLDLLAVLQRNHGCTRPPHFGEARPGDLAHSLGSPMKAAEKLGFRAQIEFTRALDELYSLNREAQPRSA